MQPADLMSRLYPMLVMGACGTRYRVRDWDEPHTWIGVLADRKGEPKPGRERLVRVAGSTVIRREG